MPQKAALPFWSHPARAWPRDCRRGRGPLRGATLARLAASLGIVLYLSAPKALYAAGGETSERPALAEKEPVRALWAPRIAAGGGFTMSIGGWGPAWTVLAGSEFRPRLFGGLAYRHRDATSEDDGFRERLLSDTGTLVIEVNPLGDFAFAPYVWLEGGAGWYRFSSERVDKPAESRIGFAAGAGLGVQYRSPRWSLGPQLSDQLWDGDHIVAGELRFDVRL